MVKRKLSLKWAAIIILLVVVVNVGYNFLNPSMDGVIKYAEHEWRHFAGQNALNLNDFKGPLIDLSNMEYFVFRWLKITNKDTTIYEVNVYRDHSEEAFISGDVLK